MSSTERFIESWKKVEHVAQMFYKQGEKFKEGELAHVLKKDFDSNKVEYCRDFRNLVQHKLKFFCVEPTSAMIQFLDGIINALENPAKISKIWVSKDKLFTASLEDETLLIMNKMQDNNYTHVPILNENELITGIFSENTLFQYFADKGIVDVGKGTQISEYKEYLPMEKHLNEKFLFVERDTTVYAIKQIFETHFAKGERIGMIFATHSGKQAEKILGIITPWDVLGKNVV
ncbi:MAG: CBS domain-containing protein [Prevotellaceae bacterium]|jgi:predicted transcriptional regulator|nr:CBS domain-containing protein [Prevotellaceae bacterium]